MALKLRLPKSSLISRLITTRWGRIFSITMLLMLLTFGITFGYYYRKYANLIQDKLEAGPFADMSMLYAAPHAVKVGDVIQPAEIGAYLRRTGYSEDSNRSRVGWYRLRADGVDINPGPGAYDSEGAVIKIANGKVAEIISLDDKSKRTQYNLEPEPIGNVFDKQRQKRRIVRFDEIPKVLVNAVLSAEDKNFMIHPGFDPFGILRAAYRDVMENRMEGASTITQQLARTLWLGTERGWRRKIPETLITLHLEQKLTKQQIFEYYANSIDIGHQGSFWIRGFGQGAQVYFGKDISQITLPEAAMLAGLPKGPAPYDPFRNPERAMQRRNIVLNAMLENGYITKPEYEAAAALPVAVKREAVESSDAPYFVDLVTENLRTEFSNMDFQTDSYKVYTSLDPELQQDAVEAVRKGIKETDDQWKKRNKLYGTDKFPAAQVALIALNTETGEILALQGGRSYGSSQLDRVLSMRQPGSAFKPFVYAAAMATGLDPSFPNPLTPASTVMDEKTAFWFDDHQPPYEPGNHDGYHGEVTLRTALAHSYNIPAVKVAEMVGYNKVAQVAKAVGLGANIKPTPAIALGSYEVRPLDIAGAYTVFANNGQLLKPSFVKAIRERSGRRVFESKIEKKNAMDPRVAYLVQNMMQEVLRSGTGAGVTRYGFNLPAAGKTGTSRDGWFVGFTSQIICAVWVGFDDNRDFVLEGAHSALPIWADFMRRAHQHSAYRTVHRPEAPDGIVTVDIDAETGELATPGCPKVRTEVFLAGTQPVQICHLHGRGGATQISGWDPVQTSADRSTVTEVASSQDGSSRSAPRSRAKPHSIPVKPEPSAATPPPAPAESKGFLGRLRDMFK